MQAGENLKLQLAKVLAGETTLETNLIIDSVGEGFRRHWVNTYELIYCFEIPKRLLREGSVNLLHHGARRPLPGSAGPAAATGVSPVAGATHARARAGGGIGEARGPRPPPPHGCIRGRRRAAAWGCT